MAEGGGNEDFPGFEQVSAQDMIKQMADQNARLLLILERLSIQQMAAAPGPVVRRSAEQIIESLSSTIKEFCFDPAAGMTFDRWFNKYEDLFSADGRELDDAAKIRLLLRSLSVPVHEKFTNYLLPQHPRDFTFDQVVQKLKTVFGQQKSLFSKRYDCLRVVKSDADDYVTYAGIVNRQCEDFDLANLTIDQFKALIFVCDMQSSKEAEVRTRLLSKLESEARGELNLEVLITECQRLSNLKHDTALVERQISSSVQAVHHQKQQHHPKKPTATPNNASLPRSPCWQCGGMHFVKDCSYTRHVCKQCNREGHKEGYCSCFNRTVKSTNENKQSQQPQQQQKRTKKKKQNQANSIHSVNQVRSGRKYVTTRINGHAVKLQLDCGSDITIISEQAWKKCGSPTLLQTEHRANTASGEQLPLLGEITCTMQIGEEQQQGTCYVTSVRDLNLLGLDFINAFDFWAKPLTSICNQVNRSNSIQPINQYLTRFPEVFRDSLGHCTKTKVKLYLEPDAQPVFRPKRPVPFHAVPKVDEELDRLQRLNIITPVDYSDWAAPIVSVRKPGGKIRVCADNSTGLNAVLKPHQYPLPTPEDIFSKLSGSKVFSIIDLSDAYLQVEVDDDSKRMLTINTHRGLFQFNRLPPGVKSAPGAFQQLMSKMIAGLEGVDSFLDDFIIYSASREQHDRILEELFKRIQDYGFHLRPEKCNFYQSEIRYLGFIINADGIKPDPAKVASIVSMPQPKDVSELRSFLGAANFYGKFVREIHRIRQPLDDLLKKDKKFVWSAQCNEAFETIKKVLQSDLLLTHYNPSLELIVAGDASKKGIGAVIMHRFPDGQLKAIAHASKTLTSTEQNYSQVEKEALALVFAVTKFRRMLLGRQFTLQTDHQPLLKVFGLKKGIPLHTANRLQRWALSLLGFDFNVEYISTDKFGYADVLSRLISNHQKPEEEYVVASISLEEDVNESLEDCFTSLPVNFKMVSAATRKDATLQQVVQFIDNGWPRKIENPKLKAFHSRRESLSVVNGCIMMEDRVVVPEFYSQRILRQLHRGHQGMERMKAIARSVVYWPNIDNDIQDLVRRCDICASAAKSPPHFQPQPWPRADGPWKRIHLDYAGPLDGMYYLVIVDSYSKWPEIFQTRSTTAAVTIRFLLETFARFGIPETLITDNGTQFCSSEFKKMCEQLGIIHIRTAPYHPQSNGQAERFVDTLKRSLRKIQQSSGQQAAPPNGTEPVPVDHHHGDSSDNDEFFEAGSTVSSPVQPGTIKTPRPVRNSRLPKRLEDYVVAAYDKISRDDLRKIIDENGKLTRLIKVTVHTGKTSTHANKASKEMSTRYGFWWNVILDIVSGSGSRIRFTYF
ncbi:uncharacterized protein K02A2.6-like [Uranotaenia lowii]|uniref:uncharacterized protein K02A2.6-like n=1 Tax=Uranotaenia lowii TaxID=190385 RepID=UPI00247B22E4|nr:uncharacterized protein K02A2.6-like [Uranotaenia lowii]